MGGKWYKASIENAKYQYDTDIRSNFFERDRNRIIYSNAFRRLGGKTQIFISGFNDNLRNRLTHTIEVNNIAKIIGGELGLDNNLIEAIALGHDIGHTPFGHMGENTLNYILNGCDNINNANLDFLDWHKGYKHNFQGIRILAYLGIETENYPGFDISDYTLWGILNHTGTKNKKCIYQNGGLCNKYYNNETCKNKEQLKFDFYKRLNEKVIFDNSWTVEGLVVQIADEISQRFHDIEDAIKAKLLRPEDLKNEYKEIFYSELDVEYKTKLDNLNSSNVKLFIPGFRHFLLNLLVDRLYDGTVLNLKKLKKKYSLKNSSDFMNSKTIIAKEIDILSSIVNYDTSFQELEKVFHKFLKNIVLNCYLTQSMDNNGDFIIKKLFEAYTSYPEQLPDYTILSFFRNLEIEFEISIDFDYKSCKTNELRAEIRSLLNTDRSLNIRAALFRTISDHVSSMTDFYASKQYEILYGINKNY
jgi:dGTPase